MKKYIKPAACVVSMETEIGFMAVSPSFSVNSEKSTSTYASPIRGFVIEDEEEEDW